IAPVWFRYTTRRFRNRNKDSPSGRISPRDRGVEQDMESTADVPIHSGSSGKERSNDRHRSAKGTQVKPRRGQLQRAQPGTDETGAGGDSTSLKTYEGEGHVELIGIR